MRRELLAAAVAAALLASGEASALDCPGRHSILVRARELIRADAVRFAMVVGRFTQAGPYEVTGPTTKAAPFRLRGTDVLGTGRPVELDVTVVSQCWRGGRPCDPAEPALKYIEGLAFVLLGSHGPRFLVGPCRPDLWVTYGADPDADAIASERTLALLRALVDEERARLGDAAAGVAAGSAD